MVAVAVTALSLGAGIFAFSRQAPSPSSPLETELESLRAQNGLYFHPVLLHADFPSIEASAYQLSVLRWAGQAPASPWPSAQAVELGRQAAARQSVWGAWYVFKIDQATGATYPEDLNRGLLGAYDPGGFFAEQQMQAGDAASEIAATAAALEVINGRRLHLTAGQRTRIAGWLGAQIPAIGNPYIACNIGRSLRYLTAPIPAALDNYVQGWWTSSGVNRGIPATVPQVLDLYGAACAMNATGSASNDRLKAIRDKLEPALVRPGDAFINYHLAAAWAESSGPPGALATLASVASSATTSSGLASTPVQRLGTIESSYYVTEIRRLAGLSDKDAQLANALRAAANGPNARQSALSELMVARTLGEIGQRDVQIEGNALEDARAESSAVVTEANAPTWAVMRDLLVELGVHAGPSTVNTWQITSVPARFSTWVVLAHPLDLAQSSPSPTFTEQLVAIPQALSRPGSALTMRELKAGIQALVANQEAGRIPAAAVRATLSGMRGCPGLPHLYRATPSATDCDLASTYEAYWILATLRSSGV